MRAALDKEHCLLSKLCFEPVFCVCVCVRACMHVCKGEGLKSVKYSVHTQKRNESVLSFLFNVVAIYFLRLTITGSG